MQVCTSLQTDNDACTPPLSFLQAGCPSCRPTNSVKALKEHSGQQNPSLRRKKQFIIIIYLLKSTEQEDAHMINTRTRAGQEKHKKLALTFCP